MSYIINVTSVVAQGAGSHATAKGEVFAFLFTIRAESSNEEN